MHSSQIAAYMAQEYYRTVNGMLYAYETFLITNIEMIRSSPAVTSYFHHTTVLPSNVRAHAAAPI